MAIPTLTQAKAARDAWTKLLSATAKKAPALAQAALDALPVLQAYGSSLLPSQPPVLQDSPSGTTVKPGGAALIFGGKKVRIGKDGLIYENDVAQTWSGGVDELFVLDGKLYQHAGGDWGSEYFLAKQGASPIPDPRIGEPTTPTPTPTDSPEGTVVEPGGSLSLGGHLVGLTADGKIILDGAILSYSNGVETLRVVNGKILQNAFGYTWDVPLNGLPGTQVNADGSPLTTPPVTDPPAGGGGSAPNQGSNPLSPGVEFDLSDQSFSSAGANTFLIRLKRPANRTFRVECYLQNGAGVNVQSQQQSAIFFPGDVDKPFIGTIGNVGDGSYALLTIRGDLDFAGNNPNVDSGQIRLIKRAGGNPPAPRANNPPPAPALISGRSRSVRLEMAGEIDRISSTPRDGWWQDSPDWGRVQTGNGEQGVNINDGTFSIVGIDNGRQGLQMTARRKPTAYNGVTYPYVNPMLYGRNRGIYMNKGLLRVRLRMDNLEQKPGFIPAWWLISKASGWQPELDIYEGGLGNRPWVAVTTHREDYGAQGLFTRTRIDDGAFHVLDFDWSDRWMQTLVDGKVINISPSVSNEPSAIIANIATGGLAPTPNADSYSMTLDYMELYT